MITVSEDIERISDNNNQREITFEANLSASEPADEVHRRIDGSHTSLKILANMLKESFEIIYSTGHIVPQRALEAGARFQACSSLPPTLPRGGPIAPP